MMPQKLQLLVMKFLKIFQSNSSIPSAVNLKPEHNHQWEVISKTFGPPRKDVSVTGIGQPSLEKALFGVTTILWKCLGCPELKKEELLGSDESTLDELIAKAEEYGPQYIMQGDQAYVVAKYIPQVQQSGNYPVR